MNRVFDFRGPSGWGRALHMPRIHLERVEPKWWQRLFGAKAVEQTYLSCMGHHTPTPWEGDELLVPMQSGKTGRFLIIKSQWIGDPRDMFDVRRADFLGYLEDQSQ